MMFKYRMYPWVAPIIICTVAYSKWLSNLGFSQLGWEDQALDNRTVLISVRSMSVKTWNLMKFRTRAIAALNLPLRVRWFKSFNVKSSFVFIFENTVSDFVYSNISKIRILWVLYMPRSSRSRGLHLKT